MSENSDLPNHRTLFETDFIRVYHNFVDNWIYSKWIGNHTLETVKSGCEQILLALQSEHCHKLLNEEREIDTFDWPGQDWVIGDFLPRLAKAGLKELAWVYSPKDFRRIATDKTIRNMPTGIIAIAFEDIEVAKDWLRSIESKEK